MKHKHTKMKYPNRLRLYRKLMGLSQTELAKKLDVPNRFLIAKWERGEMMPHGNTLLKMRRLFNTDISELYFDHYQTIEKDIEPVEQKVFFKSFKSPFPIDRFIDNDYK